MKKVVLLNGLIALMLVGCSKSSDEAGGGAADDRTPIMLSLGTQQPGITVDGPRTRGVGAIGVPGADGTLGTWNGQKLKILAFRKNKISVEAADVEDIGAVGAWATTTTQAAVSGLAWENGATLYYPIQNAYDFYGYYIDDAMNGDPVITPDTEGADAIPGYVSIPVAIDGSQDLMVAKAELTDAQKAILDTYLDAGATDEEKEAMYARAYSSYTARRGVQPQMMFKHLLSRLTVGVKAGTSEIVSAGQDGVYITSLELTDVYNKGNMIVSVASQKLEPVESSKTDGTLSLGIIGDNVADLTIDGISFKGVKPTSTTDLVPIGESVMAMPGETSFNVAIKMRQVKDGKLLKTDEIPFESIVKAPAAKEMGEDGNPINIAKDENGNILKDNKGNILYRFLEGYTYYVKLTMNGLEDIEITASLTPWKDGGDIPVTPGEDE